MKGIPLRILSLKCSRQQSNNVDVCFETNKEKINCTLYTNLLLNTAKPHEKYLESK